MDHAVHSNGSSGHEHREANLGLIIYSAIGLAVVVAAVMVLMWGTFNLIKNQEMSNQESLSPLATTTLPPEPRLEEHPSQSLLQLRQNEEQILTGYTWQDQKAGTVRIPIDRAMDLIAQRGLPVLNQQPEGAKQQQGAKPNAQQ
jgi:hypothetical protein